MQAQDAFDVEGGVRNQGATIATSVNTSYQISNELLGFESYVHQPCVVIPFVP